MDMKDEVATWLIQRHVAALLERDQLIERQKQIDQGLIKAEAGLHLLERMMDMVGVGVVETTSPETVGDPEIGLRAVCREPSTPEPYFREIEIRDNDPLLQRCLCDFALPPITGQGKCTAVCRCGRSYSRADDGRWVLTPPTPVQLAEPGVTMAKVTTGPVEPSGHKPGGSSNKRPEKLQDGHLAVGKPDGAGYEACGEIGGWKMASNRAGVVRMRKGKHELTSVPPRGNRRGWSIRNGEKEIGSVMTGTIDGEDRSVGTCNGIPSGHLGSFKLPREAMVAVAELWLSGEGKR